MRSRTCGSHWLLALSGLFALGCVGHAATDVGAPDGGADMRHDGSTTAADSFDRSTDGAGGADPVGSDSGAVELGGWDSDGSAADAPVGAVDGSTTRDAWDGPMDQFRADVSDGAGGADSASDAAGDVPGSDVAGGSSDASPGEASAGADGSMEGVRLLCVWRGDFDGDGLADCARTQVGAGTRLDLVFNKGLDSISYQGTSVVTTDVVPSTYRPVTTFDLNHDSRDDIIVHYPDPAGSGDYMLLQLFRGQADGTFLRYEADPPYDGLSATLMARSVSADTRIIDLDGDRLPDALAFASDNGVPARFKWLLIKSTGGLDFQMRVSEAINGLRGTAQFVGFGDLNSDAKLDIVVFARSNGAGGAAEVNYVGVSYGAGDGTFSVVAPIDGTQGATNAFLTRLNSDVYLDLYVNFATGTIGLYGDGAGHFSASPP